MRSGLVQALDHLYPPEDYYLATLTPEQQRFLSTQDVPLEKTFDAEGFPRWLYREIMKSDDLWVAYGVNKCAAASHTLRTRTGSCIQCSTAQLAFVKRWNSPGWIYVSVSKSIASTKIGVARDYVKRIASLNSIGYGDARDWILYNAAYCTNMGRLEHQIHRALSSYKIDAWYVREGYAVLCRELFSVRPARAWKLVEKLNV